MTSHSLIAGSIAISFTVPCFGQAPDRDAEAEKARAELCQTVLCREPTTVQVVLKDGRVMEVPFHNASPIVLPNGWVTILPGEEAHVAFDLDGDVLRNPRALKQSAEAPNTLSFRFTQDPKSGDSFLVVTSRVDHVVKFNLGMMLPDSDRLLKTSSCPIFARKQLYEHWPHPIFQIVAARFRILPPGSSTTCE